MGNSSRNAAGRAASAASASAEEHASASEAAAEAAMKRVAIRELLGLTRHHRTTEIETIFDPLAGAFTHPLDDLEGTDLPSPTIADM